MEAHVTHHGLSFDIEDWHQLLAMRVDGTPGEASADIEDCVAQILDLCDEANVKATFFVLGMLARDRPQIVRSIATRGHEIASHSSRHRPVYSLSLSDFLDDVRESKKLLEDLSGSEVVGFRAPEFSVKRLDNPCFGALVEAGFTYDSSVFPVPSLRYGIPEAPRVPFRLATSAGELVELPLATATIARWRLPIAGGSHFRLLPSAFVIWAAERSDVRGEPLTFYFHPYEFTNRFLRLSGGVHRNWSVHRHVLLHNVWTRRIRRTLRALLGRLNFVPLRTLAQSVQPS